MHTSAPKFAASPNPPPSAQRLPLRRLHAWPEVVAFFGCQHSIAAVLGLPLAIVSEWRDGADMPGRYQFRLFLTALTRNVVIEPQAFGLDPAGDASDELAFQIATRSLAALAAAA